MSVKQLLVIGKVWPEPNSSAAGTRILQIIEIFQTNGYLVTFSSAARRTGISSHLKELNIHEVEIELNNSSFDVFINDLSPDVVIFDRFMTEEQFGWRVSKAVPSAIRILDTEDLHFLREARALCLKGGENPHTNFYPYLNNEIMKRECASIMRSDFSIMISEFEIELLKKEFMLSNTKLLYLPLLYPELSNNTITASKGFYERQHFVTIGNFLHPPNWDSIVYLNTKIWPSIRKQLLEVEVHIYGAYADQKVWELHNQREGFIIKGKAINVIETLSQYKVLLAPLRFGAGQKGKLLDAMQAGLPSVTSRMGAEGMGELAIWPGNVCKGDEDFIEKAINLYTQELVWESKINRIPMLLNHKFNYRCFSSKFWEKLEKQMANIDELRAHDYMGEIMRYQFHNASKYLGKWIEEKNKK